MPPRSIRDFVNLALGGTLDDKLREHGRPGPSFDSLAAELQAKDIDVSAETLRRWAKELDESEAVA